MKIRLRSDRKSKCGKWFFLLGFQLTKHSLSIAPYSAKSVLQDDPPPNTCIGVFGLNMNTKEDVLHKIFSEYGPIKEVVIVTDNQARKRLNGTVIDGRKIRVDFSITRRAHTPTPGVYMGRPAKCVAKNMAIATTAVVDPLTIAEDHPPGAIITVTTPPIPPSYMPRRSYYRSPSPRLDSWGMAESMVVEGVLLWRGDRSWADLVLGEVGGSFISVVGDHFFRVTVQKLARKGDWGEVKDYQRKTQRQAWSHGSRGCQPRCNITMDLMLCVEWQGVQSGKSARDIKDKVWDKKELSQDVSKRIEKNSSKEFSMEFQRNADPPARETHASPAAARDDVTPSLAASLSYNSAARAPGNWADCAEDLRPGSDDSFTVVKSRKRRRESAGSPTAAAPTSNAGGSRTIRRPQSSAGSVPRAQEIRATRAHIAEARARQASSSEEHCVYIEHSPELEPFHYLRALDRMLGGTAGVIQITKVNGHQLLGLTNRGLAERLISEGLEVDGTLLRAFPFRKRAERITVSNLPFFVEDSAIINALSPYGRVTSIAPKQMKAGPYVYVDGRRDVFITLHEGITIERLPTRLDINIKGEAWPAYLSSGIRCSRCHGQGHRRAICPRLAGLANNTRSAPPTSPAGVLPPTTPAPPQRSATQPPAPAPSNPAMEIPGASPAARAVTPSAAPRPSTPVASAVPLEMAPPAPPPKAPAPEHPASPRSAATEPTPPARPDFTTPCGPLPAQGTLGPATHTPDVDMTSTEETSASSPAAVISTLPLPAPRPAEPMLPTTYREELTPPLMTPPPAPRLAGPIPPVPHGDTTTPAMTTSPPPLSMDRRWKMAGDLIHGLSREIDLEHTFQSQVDIDDIVRAVLYPGDREPFIKRLPTRDRYILGGFISITIWRARDADPSMLESMSELRKLLPA
ncbi:TRA2B [Cordylochernes scorpioides]|uniref:TRA2B n=1 Tax=Cordylochernes scorpioides TaxID=51811 RepID=A0ABY6L224_9ARAC|nr:TRA2B [Cordylochernes scorpioides]